MPDHDFAPLRNDLILRAACNEPTSRAPAWAMRQAGRYLPQYHKEKGDRDFFACCQNPEIASNITIQPIDEFDGLIDAAIIFSDILVVPQAMGMEVDMVDGKGPVFRERLEKPKGELWKRVTENEADVKKDLGYVMDAITLTRKKLNGRVPLIGFCGAPWTLMCYMVEGGGSKMFKDVKTWIYAYPKESKWLLEKVAGVCSEYLMQQVLAGAQLVQVFDSWASELSPSSFQQFALPYLQFIASDLRLRQKQLGRDPVPMIVFAKGAWYALEDLCESLYDVIALDWLQDPAKAYKIAQANGKVLQGNMDPAALYGTDEAINQEVERMVNGFGHGKKGWIANLGHGVTPFVKVDKLRHYLTKVHDLSSREHHM